MESAYTEDPFYETAVFNERRLNMDFDFRYIELPSGELKGFDTMNDCVELSEDLMEQLDTDLFSLIQTSGKDTIRHFDGYENPFITFIGLENLGCEILQQAYPAFVEEEETEEEKNEYWQTGFAAGKKETEKHFRELLAQKDEEIRRLKALLEKDTQI